jgi:transcriptional regulator of acetoin/glycerol metabolism
MFINSQGSMPREGKHRLITHQLTGTLEESLKERIHAALCANNWNFSKTATTLGIGRTTLWRKVKKYNITRDETVSVELD